jgi:DNA modification methylase
MLNWNTQKRKVNDLIPDKQNPRQMTRTQKEQLQRSIEKFDLVEIPAIDADNKVLAGHQRLAILKLLGRGNEVIDVRVPDRKLTNEEYKEYQIRSNKTTGGWNFDALANNFDMDMLMDLDFTEMDLGLKFPDIDEDDFDEVKFISKEPITKYGDIIELGRHRLMCGDATNKEDVEKLMNGKKADMVFTDPPYGIDYQDVKGKYKKIKGDKDTDLFTLLYNSLLYNVPLYVCCNWKSYTEFEKVMIANDRRPKACIVWDKGSRIQNLDKFAKQHEFILYWGKFGGCKTVDTDIWLIKRQTTEEHPTSKPIALCSKAIRYSSKQGDIVLDLFGGSGSTLIASEQTGRTCYMLELDPVYCDVIRKRYEEYIKKSESNTDIVL